MTSTLSPAPSRVAAADSTLVAMIALALLVLFLAPTRLFFIPFTYEGTYISMVPPNLIDLVWLVVGVALYMRSGRPSARVPLAAGGLMLLGAVGLYVTQAEVPERVVDLITFNSRLVGGVVIGVLMARAGIRTGLVASLMIGGTFLVALSSIYLGLVGGAQYDFYAEMQRYGGMGITPNEAGIMFAGALNMLPLMFERRPWVGLLAPVLMSGILMTGSRTAILLLLPGLWFWIPAVIRINRVGGGRALAGGVVLLSLLATIAIWLLSKSAADSVAPVAARLETSADVSNIGRLQIYLGVPFALWKDPLLLITGVGGSNVAVEWFLKEVVLLPTSHTHDLALQFLTAYGFLGLWMLWVLVRPLLRHRRRFPDADALALRWFGLTLAGGQLVQYGLYEVKFLIAFALTVGFVATITPPITEGLP